MLDILQKAMLVTLIDEYGVDDAPVQTKRHGEHKEVLIPVDEDHTAHLTMDAETYEILVTGPQHKQEPNR